MLLSFRGWYPRFNLTADYEELLDFRDGMSRAERRSMLVSFGFRASRSARQIPIPV